MLTRTRSKTLVTPTAVSAADSTSEDDFFSSQSQSASDTLIPSSLDTDPSSIDDIEHNQPDAITQQANAATIHIHCPTTITHSADAIDLTADETAPAAAAAGQSAAAGSGWTDVTTRSVVHMLPCEIHYNGPAAVTRYFRPTHTINPTLSHNTHTTHTNHTTATTYISTAAPSTTTPPTATATTAAAAAGAELSSSVWYTAAFRGRELTGEKLALPVNTIGLVLTEKTQQQQQQQRTTTRTTGSSNSTNTNSTKRHRHTTNHTPLPAKAAKAAAASVDDECMVVDGTGQSNESMMAADGGESEMGAGVSWFVDGYFSELTLWGRDTDWKGNDQSIVKRTLLDWPALAAALHDMPPVER